MFEPTSPYPMITVEEAWQRVAAILTPLPAKSLPIREAVGLVLAEDVIARENMPPFRASAMDGYAVIASDTAPARRVIGEQTAGPDRFLRVEPGTAARIMTGAPLPEGADTVVPVENTREEDGLVIIHGPVRLGAYVRPVGQDLAVGESILTRGTVLGAAEVGLLAAVGQARVAVHPRPVVALTATGDELVPPDKTPGPGRIRDSNSDALLAAVTLAGGIPLHLGRAGDDVPALRRAVLEGLERADMVLTSGGVSMGTRDLIKPILEELGTVHFGRLAAKPGKPTTFATIRGVPCFGLPGFPVSSLVMFELFVRPALRLLAGHTRLWRPQITVRLAHTIRHEPDRTEFQRAIVSQRDGGYWAKTTGDQVSGRLKSMVGANALIRLPAGRGDFPQEEPVRAILIDDQSLCLGKR
jgi:molybdenum cofactor synthesis domain-containing protein